MNTTTRRHTIAALLSVIGALLILGGTAQAATSKPAGMSNAEYRALMFRSEALNEKYHLGTYSAVPQGMTAAAYRALVLRSEALNQRYRLGAFAPATRVVTAAAGFSWSAFGIGAAAMLGLVLLASGALVGGRHGWRTPQTRISS
jgi:hypothetical protein